MINWIWIALAVPAWLYVLGTTLRWAVRRLRGRTDLVAPGPFPF